MAGRCRHVGALITAVAAPCAASVSSHAHPLLAVPTGGTAADRHGAGRVQGRILTAAPTRAPDSILVAHQLQPAANRSSEWCHQSCKRQLSDVRAAHVAAGKHLGVRAAWSSRRARPARDTKGLVRVGPGILSASPMLPALAVVLPLFPALVRISRAPLVQRVHAPGHETHGAMLIAVEADTGARIGSCSVEASVLSADGVRQPFLSSGATLRPLLTGMIVQPQARRQGVGTSLVADAAALAAEWGYDELLCNVQRGNEAARELYRRCGFAAVGDAPKENFVSWLGGGHMLFLRKELRPLSARRPAGARSRLAVMRLPSPVEEALPWAESTYAAFEVEALWQAVLEAYGSEEAAAAAVRQVRGQIVCPIFATPQLVRASREALAANLGEDEALVIMAKNPCVLTCGDGLRTADPAEIRRFAELRRVLDAIPPQAR